MFLPDLINTLQWWTIIFFIGIIFLPLTSAIFPSFFDKGYVFAKIIGIAVISYAVFVLGFLKILPFTQTTLFMIITFFAGINLLILKKYSKSTIKQFNNVTIWTIFFEEILFIGVLIFWSFIHAHQPEIHGLEKYMDFGFINSILRAKYFPPLDMWFTPFYINYYYFGHLTTAILTKLSLLPSFVTFNLMLSTISALTFVGAFSIGANLLYTITKSFKNLKILIIGGLITAFILSFAGNLHTVYTFFKPYENEYPVSPGFIRDSQTKITRFDWSHSFSPPTFPNNYWYPNATRFIHNTIHEFPIYSSVVSDLHGHFLDIPFVLLTIAILLSLINSKLEARNSKQTQNINVQNSKRFGNLNLFRISDFGFRILLLGFILAIMYMTNAWDGIIYFGLATLILIYLLRKTTTYLHIGLLVVLVFIGSILFTLPFSLNFKPFASGIGILCAPDFLVNLGKFGPFIFESNHCQHSPIWQLFILYGFFYFWVISFILFLKLNAKRYTLNASDIFVGILIILSTLLIIIPEFVYVKDIYPAHYRANTMFKLVYQSFIMLSLSTGYIIVRLFVSQKFRYWLLGYWFIGLLVVLVVFLYPYFAINSYFGNLKVYSGLNGTNYIKLLYPQDYEAILWINKNIKGQPVILEAQGDSYTDYARVSANTGLPTVLGWTVHEWLWRGTYDIPAPRIPEVVKIYESQSLEETKILLKKYNVSLVFIGSLERQKYPNLNEEKFSKIGKIIFQKGNTKVFKINIR